MIEHLRIRNFKAWKDTGDIRLAPLTVFFGTNSSGKTSIHQLLLMLKQTQASPDRTRVLHPGDDSTAVDLGTYSQLVHGREANSALSFALRWSMQDSLRFRDAKHGRDFATTSLTFDAEVFGRRDVPVVRRMRYRFGEPGSGGVVLGMQRRETGKYDLVADGYEALRTEGRRWPLPAPARFYGFPDEAVAYYQNTGFVPDLALEMERLLGRIVYVGPLREYPRRLYVWAGAVPPHVGVRGAQAVEAVLASRGREFNFAFRQRKRSLDELVGRWLQDMRLIDHFEIRPIAEGRKEYEVLVRKAPGFPMVSLMDVGFGVSQVLPVIVECFYVPARSIIIFEQPEIHLHPRVQADLADLFIDAIHAREDARERRVQVIVESHSEHFLRRLQRRIAERKLLPDEAALYFCEDHSGEVRLRQLGLNLFGYIDNWPRDFFGGEMDDVTAMQRAAMERIKAGERP